MYTLEYGLMCIDRGVCVDWRAGGRAGERERGKVGKWVGRRQGWREGGAGCFRPCLGQESDRACLR